MNTSGSGADLKRESVSPLGNGNATPPIKSNNNVGGGGGVVMSGLNSGGGSDNASYPSPTLTPVGAVPTPGSATSLDMYGHDMAAGQHHLSSANFWTPLNTAAGATSSSSVSSSPSNSTFDFNSSASAAAAAAAARGSSLSLQVKASNLSPQGGAAVSHHGSTPAAPSALNYNSYAAHSPYYPAGVGVDLSYFGATNHQGVGQGQYSSPYLASSGTQSSMLPVRTPGLPSSVPEYDAYANVERYQPL